MAYNKSLGYTASVIYLGVCCIIHSNSKKVNMETLEQIYGFTNTTLANETNILKVFITV